MTAPAERIRWTQAELVAEARARFGDQPRAWAFVCPSCDDVATAQDFIDAGADPNGSGRTASAVPLAP